VHVGFSVVLMILIAWFQLLLVVSWTSGASSRHTVSECV